MNKNFIASLSSKGQIVIPVQIRNQIHLEPGTKFFVLTDGQNILLQPIQELKEETFQHLIQQSRILSKQNKLKKGNIKEAIQRVRHENRP